MIDRNHTLPVARQARALGISRTSVYYRPRPVSDGDLGLMRRIDELHLEYPFAGSRMLRDMLQREGFFSGRRHVATLMRRMGIEALYRRPNTSIRHPAHPVHPYLLRGLTVARPGQVWAMGITYIPMSRGFVFLAAVMDWFSRKVLAWRLSITMDTAFCIETVEEALERYAAPDIFNTDQGSQFTSMAFTGLLEHNGIAISMDGKGSWRDNVFVERLWRSVKYEEVYLRAYGSVSEARASIGRYFAFYNSRQPNSSLGGMTPDEFYARLLPEDRAAQFTAAGFHLSTRSQLSRQTGLPLYPDLGEVQSASRRFASIYLGLLVIMGTPLLDWPDCLIGLTVISNDENGSGHCPALRALLRFWCDRVAQAGCPRQGS
jgi:putative transposase